MESDMKEEKKKKSSMKKKIAWIGGTLLIGGIVAGFIIKDRKKKMVETKNIGNMMKDESTVLELNPGKKEFVTIPEAVGFIDEQNGIEGLWVHKSIFKKGINPERLESVTGKPNFNIRYGQDMNYKVNCKLNPFMALWKGVKQYSGYIPLRGN